MYQTQLSDYNNFDVDNIRFSKPEAGNIPGQKISFKRIRLSVANPGQKTFGDLVFSTPPNLLSYGVQENRDLATNQVNGYVFPLCLWNRNGASEEEQRFTDIFSAVVEKCKEHLLSHKDDIEKYDLEATDLKKLNPLYWKLDKGKIVEGRGPMLYVKCQMSKKDKSISTLFVDEETNEEINPMELQGKQCLATAALKFESIFIGNKISIQLKLFEAVVKVVDTSVRGLLRPNVIRKDVSEQENTTTDVPKQAQPTKDTYESSHENGTDDDDDDDDSSVGSLVAAETAVETTPPPTGTVSVSAAQPKTVDIATSQEVKTTGRKKTPAKKK